jgi:hypothetical protein
MGGSLPNGHFARQAIFAHRHIEQSLDLTDRVPMPARQQPRSAPDFLRKWRVHKSLTLEQVATIVGVGPQAVHKWETGKTPVTLETLRLLASAYGTTPAALLFDPEDPSVSDQVRAAVEVMEKLPPETRALWLASGKAMVPKSDIEN